MTDMRFFGYKSLIYEPNLTKFKANVGIVAAHKPCEFQVYRFKESSLRGEEVKKISDLRIFPNMSTMLNMSNIGAVVRPCGGKTEKRHSCR